MSKIDSTRFLPLMALILFYLTPGPHTTAVAQSSADHTIPASVIDEGGGISTSEKYQMLDVVGQPSPVGNSGSGVFTMHAGYLTTSKMWTAIDGNEVIPDIPTRYRIYQNYPNPFNPQTTIRFDLPERGYVEIRILDILGRNVRTLIAEEKEPGYHQVVWDGLNNGDVQVSSGVYFYRISTKGLTETRKLLLLR